MSEFLSIYAQRHEISATKDFLAKSALTRSLIESQLAKNDFAGIGHTLEYANAAKLDLPEYTAEFLDSLYARAMQIEDFYGAWQLACTVLSSHRKMVKSPPIGTEWADKVQVAFEADLQCMLAKIKLAHDEVASAEFNQQLEVKISEIRRKTNNQFGDGPYEALKESIKKIIGQYKQVLV